MLDSYELDLIEEIFIKNNIEKRMRPMLLNWIEQFEKQYELLEASELPKGKREYKYQLNDAVKNVVNVQKESDVNQDVRIALPLMKQDNINRLYAGLKKYLLDEPIRDIVKNITEYDRVTFYKGDSFDYLVYPSGFVNLIDKE